MLLQTSTPIYFEAPFTASKTAKTGLTNVTVNVWRGGTALVTGATATEVGDGLYSYTLVGTSATVAGSYVAVFKTTDATVDSQIAYSLWRVGETWVQNVDAAVSSRSTYAGGDTAGTGTLLSRLTDGRALKLDNLDTTVSSRSSHSAADIWAVSTRTLTSFGTLVTDLVTAVWSAPTRVLTAFNFLTDYARRTGDYATAADVQVTVPTPVVNVAAPIVNPTPVTVSGGYTGADRARDAATNTNVASVKGHFDMVLAPEQPATILPASTDGQKKWVRVETAPFIGVGVKPGISVTLRLADSRAKSVVIGGKWRPDKRDFTGVTANFGVFDSEVSYVDLLVWDSATLTGAGLRPVYDLLMEGTTGVQLKAPLTDSRAETLKIG